MVSRRVAVIPHTHWDREWYRPFQSFRADLVELIDDLLPRLDDDPSSSHFMLDGQMAVIDDYLEIRPEAEPTLQRLATSGRISVGPWYVLMDEFLVSGETIVRNLAMGLDRAAAFGGAMPVGYLPDMFGHIAQMPQILTQFGFEHAVVWRGTPSAVDRTGFWWHAPDGSVLRAEYTPQGYGNGARLPDDAQDLVERITEFDSTHSEMIAGGPVLWMNGTDHQVPSATLGALVANANELQDTWELEITSLPRYLAEAGTDDLPSWTGELRSGARANLLMGVASNRTDVRQAAARAERALERLAEPLSTMAGSVGFTWPQSFLDLAWRNVILNSAHDSVCACSVDEVCDAVLVRYAEANQIADAVSNQALGAIARSLADPGAIIVNTSHRTRSGLVELTLPGKGARGGMQLIDEVQPLTLTHTVTRADAPTVVERELDIHLGVHGLQIDHSDDAIDVTIHADPSERSAPVFGWAISELRALALDDPNGEVRIWIRQPPTRRVLVRIEAVPGLGWTPWVPAELDVDPVRVGTDGLSLDNVLVNLTVDPVDGTFAVNGHEGLGRLVDEGDAGDTYNFSPPANQTAVDTPESVQVSVVERGPLLAALEVTATYRWPEQIVDDARVGEIPVEVVTRLELRAGESTVRVTTEVDNQSKDHRLRVLLPLVEPTATSRAECAFGTVDRGLTAEGGETERAMATFPSRRFVHAGGITVVHEGLLEYELIDIADDVANTLAVTLLRCTGWLSRGPMAYRPLPAGPEIETPGAQMPGPQIMRWAVHVTEQGQPTPDPYALVDEVFLPLLVTRSEGGADAPSTHRSVELTGAEVSAVTARGPRVEVRVFNPRPEPTTVSIPNRTGRVCDLGGQLIEQFDGEVSLGPWRIATLSLDPPPEP